MSQPSYLQQIAQRASGRLAGLMPPRSPFQHWEAAVPLEIPEESPPPLAPVSTTIERSPAIPPPTTIKTASLANPPIQLQGTTLEPFPTSLAPIDPVMPNPDLVTWETSSDAETTEPRNSPSLQSESVDRDSSAIAPQALQPPKRGLPSEQKPYVTQSPSPPPQRTIAAVPSIADISNPLADRPDRTESLSASLTENRPPTESPSIVRWLTPTVQDSTVEKSLQESALSAISSEGTASPIPLVDREQSLKGNTIHIGAIDIQIMPAPVAPAAIAPPPAKPVSTTPLARGFSGSFGLRQG